VQCRSASLRNKRSASPESPPTGQFSEGRSTLSITMTGTGRFADSIQKLPEALSVHLRDQHGTILVQLHEFLSVHSDHEAFVDAGEAPGSLRPLSVSPPIKLLPPG
jgi:hypothetical protein